MDVIVMCSEAYSATTVNIWSSTVKQIKTPLPLTHSSHTGMSGNTWHTVCVTFPHSLLLCCISVAVFFFLHLYWTLFTETWWDVHSCPQTQKMKPRHWHFLLHMTCCIHNASVQVTGTSYFISVQGFYFCTKKTNQWPIDHSTKP